MPGKWVGDQFHAPGFGLFPHLGHDRKPPQLKPMLDRTPGFREI
jgi:hypothetical protein